MAPTNIFVPGAPSIGRRRRRIDLGTVSTGITIPDTNTFPNDRYSKGSYLAIQAINDAVSTRSQSMNINPVTFPANTKLNWSWPAGADTSVKAWNAVDYGDYLQTTVPNEILPSKISAISTLKELHSIVYSDNNSGIGANAALDLFLYNKPISGNSNMVCEIEVFFHTPTSTKTFIDSLTSLGTYTSASIDGTASIVWKVGRQASNFFGTPYYLFYPADQSDKPIATFDLKAMFNWLSAANPTTGLTYLTGNEYYTGHGIGAEPMKGAGSLTINNLVNTYAITAGTNLIPAGAVSDMTNAFWASTNATLFATKMIEDTSVTTGHGNIGGNGASKIVKPATAGNYIFSFNADNILGHNAAFVQVCTPDFGGTGNAQVYFDLLNGAIFPSPSFGGTYTLLSYGITPIGGGRYNCFLVLNLGASGVTAQDINVDVIVRMADGNFAQNYTGNGVRGMNIDTFKFYQI